VTFAGRLDISIPEIQAVLRRTDPFNSPPAAAFAETPLAVTLVTILTRSMMILCHLTTQPLKSNTLTLDPEIKDAWGVPAIRVTYRNHPDDLKNKAFFGQRALELLRAAGALKMWAAEAQEETNSVHLMGTCRMGDDFNRSVVDKYHRTHDVPNLFLVDGSSFVSAGRNQPTCTIQALAYRAAYAISEAAKKGRDSSALLIVHLRASHANNPLSSSKTSLWARSD
jgi:choline dehydrogenase-like flavoprotein